MRYAYSNDGVETKGTCQSASVTVTPTEMYVTVQSGADKYSFPMNKAQQVFWCEKFALDGRKDRQMMFY